MSLRPVIALYLPQKFMRVKSKTVPQSQQHLSTEQFYEKTNFWQGLNQVEMFLSKTKNILQQIKLIQKSGKTAPVSIIANFTLFFGSIDFAKHL